MTDPKTVRVLLLGLVILGTSGAAGAQQEVDYPALGLRFEVPSGWRGQEGDGLYLIQHPQESAMLVLMPHEAITTAELEAGAREGIHVADGSSLELIGQPEAYDAGGVRLDMAGLVDWTPVQAHAIGLLSPHGGPGVTVLAIAPNGQFSEVHRGYAETVAEGIVFSAPVEPPVVEEWRNRLLGWKLSSYNTRGSWDGGSSSSEAITLCEGYFRYYGSHSFYGQNTDGVGNDGIGLDGTGVSGAGSSEHYGTWEVASDYGEGAVLRLTYEDGGVASYALSRSEDGKTYLDGERVLRTDGGCQ